MKPIIVNDFDLPQQLHAKANSQILPDGSVSFPNLLTRLTTNTRLSAPLHYPTLSSLLTLIFTDYGPWTLEYADIRKCIGSTVNLGMPNIVARGLETFVGWRAKSWIDQTTQS